MENTAIALQTADQAIQFSILNNKILSFFAVAIPGVFGSAATYLIGRGTMEAGLKSMVEGLYFMQKLGGMVSGLAKGVGKYGGSIGRAAGTATRMGVDAIKAAPGAIKAAPGAIKNAPDTVRNLWKDRQITKELYDHVNVGNSAKALGVKMQRSTAENITKAIGNGNGFVQDKEGGVSAFYDKNYNLRGIMKKDGTMVNANSLSAEERAKYDLDMERSFGVIDTETGDFVSARFNRQAEITPNYTENRIGKIKDKKTLEELGKMLN